MRAWDSQRIMIFFFSLGCFVVSANVPVQIQLGQQVGSLGKVASLIFSSLVSSSYEPLPSHHKCVWVSVHAHSSSCETLLLGDGHLDSTNVPKGLQSQMQRASSLECHALHVCNEEKHIEGPVGRHRLVCEQELCLQSVSSDLSMYHLISLSRYPSSFEGGVMKLVSKLGNYRHKKAEWPVTT